MNFIMRKTTRSYSKELKASGKANVGYYLVMLSMHDKMKSNPKLIVRQ